MMKKLLINLSIKLRNNHGAIAVVVGIAMTALIGFSALAIDLGHLYVVKNELQNAADAGALAGARVLYNDAGTVVNTGANETGYYAAVSNNSEGVSVDVHGLEEGLQDYDVQRGHWSFTTGDFRAEATTNPPDLLKSTADLDVDPFFINAVKVTTRREDTPAASFLARIFGHDNFIMSADAVAYKGFAGTLAPGESEMPIAICRESILKPDKSLSCNTGRMINSGSNELTSETAGWTSYAQQQEPGDPDPCSGGTNANEVRNIVDPPGGDSCFGENLAPLILGKDMATIGGEAETVLSRVRNCWVDATDTNGDGIPDIPWTLRLPVITCPGNNVNICEEVVGAVEVNLVWITGPGANSCHFQPGYYDAEGVWVDANLPPLNMGDGENAWHCINQSPATEEEMQACWDSFVDHFNLENVDGTAAPCAKKSLYFMPDCGYHEPVGRSSGENFGILAEIPALVE
jgi:Flp pilus assembly protein TadG